MREDILRRRAESDILKDPHGIEAMREKRENWKMHFEGGGVFAPYLIDRPRQNIVLHELLIEVAQLWLETWRVGTKTRFDENGSSPSALLVENDLLWYGYVS
jgi:hypothetical protein